MQVFASGLFRTQFPEFQDTVTYPDQMIDFWAELAQLDCAQCVYKTAWLKVVSLYTAHEITLAAQSIKSAAAGGMPGTSGGIANTKTVGSVTVGYDSQITGEKDAGHWNLTNYGKMYYRLMRLYGTQCVQL